MQYVSYNSQNSAIKHITCGVPQGSNFGLLLFILYVNDLIHKKIQINDLMKSKDQSV